MANQYYELISQRTIQIENRTYATQIYNKSLKNFLIENFGKKIYIYEPSINTNRFEAIVL
jgi:hypothetical protein